MLWQVVEPLDILQKKQKKSLEQKGTQWKKKCQKSSKELKHIFIKLEKHYRDMQDIEFTVENNKLWMLQTRNGKRTANAAIKITLD